MFYYNQIKSVSNNHTTKNVGLPFYDSMAINIENLLKQLNMTPAWSLVLTTIKLFAKLKNSDCIQLESNVVNKSRYLDRDSETLYIGETAIYQEAIDQTCYIRNKNP